MEDLTDYSEDELSLWVFNDEGLYSQRHDIQLFDMLDELFTYTVEQKEQLLIDLEEDQEDE